MARLGRSRNMSGRVGVLDIRHEGRAPSRLTPGKRLQPVFNSPRRRLSSRLRRAALMISPRDPICAGETHRVVPHRDLYARDVKGVECRERRDATLSRTSLHRVVIWRASWPSPIIGMRKDRRNWPERRSRMRSYSADRLARMRTPLRNLSQAMSRVSRRTPQVLQLLENGIETFLLKS